MSGRGRAINAKGRFQAGETFAIIPVDVLTSRAYAALPDYAARVLLALAAQYRGTNNGNLALTRDSAARFGIGSGWKVSAALKLLTITGLIRRTREGKAKHGKGICALYAVAWKQIDPTPQACPPIEHERPASGQWAAWTPPDDWPDVVHEAKRTARGDTDKAIFPQSPRRDRTRTPRRDRNTTDPAVFVPNVGTERGSLSYPTLLSPSRTPPEGVSKPAVLIPHSKASKLTAAPRKTKLVARSSA
jgi:hypothetical protein